MPEARRMKTAARIYETRAVATAFILLIDQTLSAAVITSPSARKRKAREVGSAGGINIPPYIRGLPKKYASSKTREVARTTHANTKATVFRFRNAGDEVSVACKDRAMTRKQAAVNGDMCPIGTPPTVPSIEIHKC